MIGYPLLKLLGLVGLVATKADLLESKVEIGVNEGFELNNDLESALALLKDQEENNERIFNIINFDLAKIRKGNNSDRVRLIIHIW